MDLRSIIKPFRNIPFSVHLSFQTENIPHSRPGFLPDAPQHLKSYDIQLAFAACGFAELCSIQYLSIRILEYSCMLVRLPFIIYFILILNSTEGRALYRLPSNTQAGIPSHPLPAISLLNFLKIPSSASSSSGSPYSTYTQNPSLGNIPIFTISSTFASSYCCRKRRYLCAVALCRLIAFFQMKRLHIFLHSRLRMKVDRAVSSRNLFHVNSTGRSG